MTGDQGFHPDGGLFDVSRDGSLMVYRRRAEDGASELWARRLDASDAAPIQNTRGAGLPAISPDGREVAFAAGDPAQIRVATVNGADSRTLVGSASPGGVRWSPDGTWVYYTNASSGLSRVPAGGGSPEVLTRVDPAGGDEIHWAVEVLPGGRGIVYTASERPVMDPRIEVLNMETGEVDELWTGSFPRYSETGYLLFTEADGATLSAAPFDIETLGLTGAPRAVANGLLHPGDWPLFSVSQAGAILYAVPNGVADVTPVWVQRDGSVQEIDPGWRHRGHPTFSSLALSPAGDRLVMSVPDLEGNWHLWLKRLDADTAPPSRLTFGGALNYRPTWSSDGRTLTFISDREGQADLWTTRADGAGAAERILDRRSVVRNGFYTPDEAWLVFREGEAPVADIFAIRPETGAEARPVVVTEFGERSPAVSPDGRWVAYTSNESGRWHVWVTAFLDADPARWRVSADGGQEPRWAHDGRELFYRNQANELVAVEIGGDPTFESGRQEVLFSMEDYLGSDGRAQYDVGPDDERFVMLRFEEAEGVDLVLLENFFEQLMERPGN
jgi:serine/threonine-protein kinase